MPTPLHPLNDEVYPIPGPRFVSIVALPLDLRDPLDITGLPLDIRDTGDITGLPLDLQNTAEISQNFTAGKFLIGNGTNPIAESAYLTETGGASPYCYVPVGSVGASPYAFGAERDTDEVLANPFDSRGGIFAQAFGDVGADIPLAFGVEGYTNAAIGATFHRAVAFYATDVGSGGTIEKAIGFASFENTQGTVSNIGLFLGSGHLTLADAPSGDWAIYSASTRESHLTGPFSINYSTYGNAFSSGQFFDVTVDGVTLDMSAGAAHANGQFNVSMGSSVANFGISKDGGFPFFNADAFYGLITLNGVQYAFPAADGSASQVLTTDGAANLSWATVTPGGSGTVTSITSGDGITLTPGTITTTGSVAVDATVVRTSRTISTTLPLTGGGDLSANRTLAISDFIASGASHARGAVPDPGSTPGTTKFLREDATWALPPVATVTGSGTAGQATFWTSSTNISSDAAFLWDNTNKRLGLGGTPSVQLHTTSRAILASGLADPASNGQTLLQVGDASGGIDASWRFGVTYSGIVSDLPASGGFYGFFSYAKNTSTSTPNFIVGGHMGAETTTTMTAVEGYAGTAGATNASGNITLNNVRAAYVSPYTTGAGSKTITNMFGSWSAPQLDGAGVATITNLFNYKADNSQTAGFGQGVGRLTAGVITNLYGYLYTHPTTGTVGNEYAFYSEATKTGAADTSWQVYMAGTYGQTGYFGTGGKGTGAKSYFGARVGIGCEDPLSQLEVDNTGFPQTPSGIIASYHAADPVPPPLTFVKSRGTRGAPAAVIQDDWCGLTYSAGYDGSNYVTSNYFGSKVDGAVSAGSVPMAWFVATGTNNNPTEYLRVTSVGTINGVGQPGAGAYNTTDQTIPNTVLTSLQFDTNEWTQGGSTRVHDGSTNNDRFVAPVDGIYMAECEVTFHAGPSAVAATITKHGAATVAVATSGVMGGTVAHVSAIVKMAATDYVVFGALQVSAGNVDTIQGSEFTFGRLIKLW